MGFVTNPVGTKSAAKPSAVPAAAAKVAAQPTEEKQAKESGFRTLGRFALNVAKEAAIAIPRALATPIATVYQDITALRTKNRPESVKVPILGEIGVSEDPVKAAGQLGGRALDIGLALSGGTVVKAGVKTLAEETAAAGLKQGIKAATESGFKAFVKAAPKDAAVGGAYGFATGLAESENPSDILKSTVTGSIFGTLAPPVLGAATKVGIKGTRVLSKSAADVIDKTATKLEARAAAVETREAVKKQLETPGYWGDIPTTPTSLKKPGVVDRMTAPTAKALRTIQAVPDKLATAWYDKFHPVKRFQQLLEKEGIDAPDLHEEVQAAQYRGFGTATNKLDDYLGLRYSYGDDWRYVKMFARYQDDLDDLALGKPIQGDRDVASVQGDLTAFLQSLPLQTRQRVHEGAAKLQAFLNRELLEAVESGRISPKQFEDIKSAHPNYIPHSIIDDMAEEAAVGAGGSFQLLKSGIENREGLTKQRTADVDTAVIERILNQSLLNEKNKTNLTLFNTIAGNEDKLGFKPLRTAANVELREEYYKTIAQIRDDIAAQIKVAKGLKDVDRTVVRRLEQLSKRLGEKEDKFFADLAAYGGEAGDYETNRLRAFRERDTAARANFLRDFSFGNGEQEIGYDHFKELARRRPWILDEGIDQEALKARLKGFDADRYLFAGANADTTNDELLDAFKKRYRTEKTAPKPDIRFAQRVEALQKRMAENESVIKEIGQEQIGLKQDRPAMTGAIRVVEERIVDLEGLKSDIMADLKNHADIKIRAKDARKDGFETYKFFRNGVREEWLMPDDLGRALKHMDSKEADAFINFFNNTTAGKIITKPASLTRLIATQRNPMFALIANPSRDAQTVAITSGMAMSIADYATGLKSAKTGQKIADDLLRLARKEGAIQGSVFRENEDASKVLKTMLHKLGRTDENLVSRLVKKTGDIVTLKNVEEAGQIMEETTRLAVFSRAIKNGVAPRQAAKLARNATVDFGKSGSWMKVVNRVIPFLNARVQGFGNLGAAIERDPTRAMRQVMYTAAWPAALLTSWNLKYDAFKNVPDNERRKYWIVMLGQTKGEDNNGRPIDVPYYIKIPKGEAQQIASIAVERVLTAGLSKYPESTRLFMSKLINDVSPVTESSIGIPYYSKWKELQANYSFFREKQIEGDYTKVGNKWYKTDELEPRLHIKNDTSEIAKWLGNLGNWSPVQIDYVAKQGVVNDLLRSYDLVVDGWSKETGSAFERAAELPFVRSLIGTSSYGEQTRQKEFEKKEIQMRNTEKIRRLKKANESTKAVPQPGGLPKPQPRGFVTGR